jgi:hypothetical protein
MASNCAWLYVTPPIVSDKTGQSSGCVFQYPCVSVQFKLGLGTEAATEKLGWVNVIKPPSSRVKITITFNENRRGTIITSKL